MSTGSTLTGWPVEKGPIGPLALKIGILGKYPPRNYRLVIWRTNLRSSGSSSDEGHECRGCRVGTAPIAMRGRFHHDHHY